MIKRTPIFACLFLWTSISNAIILTFTDESDYLSAISSSTTIYENFDDGAWNKILPGGAENVLNQGLSWSSSDFLKTIVN